MDDKPIVINTGPIIALVAGLGSLDLLDNIFTRVLVPYEVCQEIDAGGRGNFAIEEFQNATFLRKVPHPVELPTYLSNALDVGEAAVIHTALEQKIDTVCIDEVAGRRIARLHNLKTTGSIGICLLAQEKFPDIVMTTVIKNKEKHGIYLSQQVKNFALNRGG